MPEDHVVRQSGPCVGWINASCQSFRDKVSLGQDSGDFVSRAGTVWGFLRESTGSEWGWRGFGLGTSAMGCQPHQNNLPGQSRAPSEVHAVVPTFVNRYRNGRPTHSENDPSSTDKVLWRTQCCCIYIYTHVYVYASETPVHLNSLNSKPSRP